MQSKLPLAGIRVIDFGRFIAGPYCAMLLADMGADVIRVDRRHGSEDRYIAAITKSGEGRWISFTQSQQAQSDVGYFEARVGGNYSPLGARRGCSSSEPA